MRLLSICMSRKSFLKLDRIFRIFLHRPSPLGSHTASGQERGRRVVASARVFVFLTKIYTISTSCALLLSSAIRASRFNRLASVIVTLHRCRETARRYKMSSRSPSPSLILSFLSPFLHWCGLKGTSASKVGKNLSYRVFVH